jgi:hypothetical protein
MVEDPFTFRLYKTNVLTMYIATHIHHRPAPRFSYPLCHQTTLHPIDNPSTSPNSFPLLALHTFTLPSMGISTATVAESPSLRAASTTKTKTRHLGPGTGHLSPYTRYLWMFCLLSSSYDSIHLLLDAAFYPVSPSQSCHPARVANSTPPILLSSSVPIFPDPDKNPVSSNDTSNPEPHAFSCHITRQVPFVCLPL